MKEHFRKIEVFYILDVVILTWVCAFDISYNYTPKMVGEDKKKDKFPSLSDLEIISG